MPDSSTRIRELLREKLIEFVKNNQEKEKILLVRLPPGTGKTVTGSQTLFSRDDILTIWLSPNHGQIEDTVTKHNDVFHLKGRRILCYHRLLDEFDRYNVDIKRVLCMSNCEELKEGTCEYFNQFRELRETPQSFVSVHHHLNTKFIGDYFKKNQRRFPNKCLVIDENPIGNLKHEISFNKRDLINLIIILDKVCDDLEREGLLPTKAPKVIDVLHLALINILREKDATRGASFVNQFMKHVSEYKYLRKDDFLTFEEIEKILKSKKMAILVKRFNDEIYKYFETGHRVKNIILEILFIAKKCIFYSKKESEHFGKLKITKDFNLPFYSDFEEFKSDGMSATVKVIRCAKVVKELPKVPIIIMDASGDKEFYSSIFEREVEEFDLKGDIERNIIQVMDGKYNIASLSKRRTRKNVYNAVFCIVKHHLDKGEPRVAIVTIKKFEGNLKRYLTDRGIDETQLYMNHYGNIRGLNVMEEDKTLILMGTPEPNIESFPKDVAYWYEGEIPINTDRIKERKRSVFFNHDYRYKDPRYFTHIRRIREHEIEQTIDRLRFFLYPDKKAYLFSMLPIDFPTQETTISELLREIDPKARIQGRIFEKRRNPFYVYLKYLEDGDTKTDIYRKIENVVPFNEGRSKIKTTRTILLEEGKIVEEDGRLMMTKEGKDYLKKAKEEISRLKSKLSI